MPVTKKITGIFYVVPPAGFEPATVFTHRIKSPFPSAARDMEALNGGTNLIRTSDRACMKRLLYQLSYSAEWSRWQGLNLRVTN